MKIGIIAHDAHPIKEPFQGGLEMITFLFVNELYVRGHDVTTLCNKGSDLPGTMMYYSTTFSDEELEPELSSIGDFSISFNRFVEKEFDIIHNHSLHHQAIILGNHINSPFITTFHTPIFGNLNVGIRCILGNVKQTFTGVSSSLSKKYEELLPKVSTIYNGIDISKWKYHHLHDDYYSWSGRICKEKGLKEIIDLCENARINLKIAGPISNNEYFHNEIVPRLSISKFCKYEGHLNQIELNDIVGRSKGFIFSSTWDEPYGLVIAEALSCGVPVIANDVGAASEIINAKSGVLYNLENAKSFKHAILQAETINRKNCRQRAIDFCTHQKMVDNYISLYYSLGSIKLAV